MFPPLTFGAVSDLGQRDRGFVGDAGRYLGHVRIVLDQRYPMGAPTGGDLAAVHRIVGGAFDLSFAGCGALHGDGVEFRFQATSGQPKKT